MGGVLVDNDKTITGLGNNIGGVDLGPGSTQRKALRIRRAGCNIFRARWLPALQREAASLRAHLPGLIAAVANADGLAGSWLARNVSDAIRGVETILPEEDFTLAHLEIAALAGETARTRHAA